jgi:type IV pilus assembly protein PilE
VAVTGLLSSIAYPAFTGTIAKARRTDAHVALMQLQLAQERHRSNAPSYGSLEEIRLANVSPSRHYRLSVAAATADRYEARATATGLQSADARCRHLKLIVDGAQVIYASGADATTANDAAANRQCWGGR